MAREKSNATQVPTRRGASRTRGGARTRTTRDERVMTDGARARAGAAGCSRRWFRLTDPNFKVQQVSYKVTYRPQESQTNNN